MSEENRDDDGGGGLVLGRPPEMEKLREPPKYACVLLNDDFTPMEFVTAVLQQIFKLDEQKSEAIMMDVHTKGKGVAAIYSRDIAETRSMQVNQIAQASQHPLKCEIEQVGE